LHAGGKMLLMQFFWGHAPVEQRIASDSSADATSALVAGGNEEREDLQEGK
jgi:hypothetical protein